MGEFLAGEFDDRRGFEAAARVIRLDLEEGI
jgi:hypothetical protein